MGSRFPWDVLKAECLRLICLQVTGGRLLQRREEMIDFLKEVNENGLDLALTSLGESNSNTPTSPVRKRKTRANPIEEVEGSDHESKNSVDAYNTRYKGAKRVKMTKQDPDETPAPPKRGRGRPRKSAPAALATQVPEGQKLTAGISNGVKTPTKRSRGRPPKNAPQAGPSKTAPEPPKGKVKQVFDGVLLPSRRKHTTTPNIPRSASPHDPDADAEGEMDIDVADVWEQAPPAASSPHKSLDGVEESSLGDSNKENESHPTQPIGQLPPVDDTVERPPVDLPPVPVAGPSDELVVLGT